MPRYSNFLCLLLFTLALIGCGKDSPAPTTRTYPDVGSSLEEAQRDAVKLLGEKGDQARAVWNAVPGSADWTTKLLSELSDRREKFEAARDLEDFCPGYAQSTSFQRDTCWLRIFSAMAKYESSFRPAAVYVEAAGSTSVGLLMMDPALCSTAPTVEKLKDAAANIQCALQRMQFLITRDGFISGTDNKGGAAFWSVLRAPYQVGKLYLGRRPHIQLFTRSYRAFPSPQDN